MDALNIGFGVIGVISLAYAIVSNRRAASRKELVDRLTLNILELSQSIVSRNHGNSTEGYARSIVQVAESLLGDAKRRAIPSGRVLVRYPSFIPPMRTDVGEVCEDSKSKSGYAIAGKRRSEARKGLLYGPYETLPMSGRYSAEFRLRLEVKFPESMPIDTVIVDLDVYDYGTRTTLGKRSVTAAQLSADDYIGAAIPFEYDDSSQQLEYRASIVVSDIRLLVQDVEVSRDTV